MTEILRGANPGVRLFDGDVVTVFASIWVVETSVLGPGRAIVLWHDGRVRVLGTDLGLGRWLERAFVRHFPEAVDLPWPEPTTEHADVQVEIDAGHGLRARGGNVEITMSDPLARRRVEIEELDLGGVAHGVRLTFIPCAQAVIEVGGRRLPGVVRREGDADRPSSSAFLTVDEVWTRPTP